MARRSGERAGWIVGWIGSFLWVVALGVVLLVRGRAAAGLGGLALGALAVPVMLLAAPWRHPETRFWKLMLPLYALLGASVVWAVATHGGARAVGLGGWEVAWLVPLLLPFFTAGSRRWSDGER